MGMPKTRGCPYHCNNTNSAIWPVPYLPACRRLLFPLLHACNKGNRRRLHAGKCLTHAHNHHLGSGSHGQLFRPCWGSSAWLSRRTFVRTKLRFITGPGKFFAKASGIVSLDVVFSYWPISFPRPRSLCGS